MTRAVERDAAHLVRGFMRLSDRHRTEPIVIERGHGVWVYDEHGTPYLEAVAGMWCATFGFGEEALIEAATEQLRTLPYYHTLTNKSVGVVAELAERLASLVPVPGAKVHLAVSGSEANDFLVKFVRYANNARGDTRRKTFVSRVNGYHGATMAASSLTGIARNHEAFDLPLPGFVHTADPHWWRDHRDGEDEAAFVERMAAELEALVEREGPDTIAGFLAEPVSGGGGVVIPPPGYYDAVQAVLDRHAIPFFSDEVICGFGRTGDWFGAQTFGIRADGMTLGKGLSAAYQPIAALVLSGEIYDAMEAASDGVGTFAHGSTYSGHPVAAAVALRTIALVEERDLVGHVRAVAPRFAARLAALADHPLVGDARSIGLMGAVELVPSTDHAPGARAGLLRSACEDEGLIVRATAIGDTIAFSPPLVITDAEVDEVFDRFERALARIG